jgi:hypothetical protein
MITLADFYMGRDQTYARDLTDEVRRNAERTVAAANKLLNLFGEHRDVNSGWRPAAVNATTPGAAMRSKHMLGLAVDLSDPDGALDDFLFIEGNVENPWSPLTELNLWQEHPAATKGWCHIQIVPYGSWSAGRRRWFYP